MLIGNPFLKAPNGDKADGFLPIDDLTRSYFSISQFLLSPIGLNLYSMVQVSARAD
jgi:hypothetical protein